ncbi:hypothetical protein HanXRQr2_Chr16g0750331 [Helianthus annuus]|uniref:Uncharacterized protein n=1 Tax=Helianthus annuus TaxID=4232 RepID=A0A9K3DTT9_HELAN|nr:hypothetical protein HanXRQr2_Chr16g0750331 [Helianthus annuus]
MFLYLLSIQARLKPGNCFRAHNFRGIHVIGLGREVVSIDCYTRTGK